jgi:hypothetical protein
VNDENNLVNSQAARWSNRTNNLIEERCLMMKLGKLMLMIVVAAGALFNLSTAVYAAKPISVLLDGVNLDFGKAKPFADKQNHVLVPLRFVSEKLGTTVNWTQATKTVTISATNLTVTLVLGSSKASVNGIEKELGTQAVEKSGSIYVPLRFVSEALSKPVKWDKVNSRVLIGKVVEQPIASMDDDNLFPPVALSKYKYLYKNNPYPIEGDDINTVKILDARKMSVIIPNYLGYTDRDTNINKIWYDVEGGEDVIRIRYSGPHIGIVMLTGDGNPHGVSIGDNSRKENEDGSITATFLMYDFNTEEYIKPKDVKFVQLRLDSKYYVLINADF